jgi:Flp pilus assembly protein TadG
MRNLIGALGRPLARLRVGGLRGSGERGAVGVLVVVLLGGGVLTGMGALVVDVGQLYQNRAELQSGADAGALAVAQSCAQGTCTPSSANYFAGANAATGLAAVNLVCGSGGQAACPASNGKIFDCPAAPAAGTNYVDVHTATKTPTGSLLPPAFASSLLGNGRSGARLRSRPPARLGSRTADGTMRQTAGRRTPPLRRTRRTRPPRPPPTSCSR